jgi:hypothetical protein
VSSRARLATFAGIVLACAAVGGGYVAYAALGDDGPRSDVRAELLGPGAARRLAASAYLAFRNTARDGYGEVALAPLARPAGPRGLAGLSCERVHVAAGHGICLRADRGVLTSYDAVLFDRGFRELARVDLAGAPSRARVSPDGRLAAYTVFVTGHSYADGRFSTRTAIVDATSGRELLELEQLRVLDGEREVRGVDFNFWGVTFAREPGRFYATLGTKGHTYLVEGDLERREARILRDGVECPSLSPDGKRVAFKEREGAGPGPVTWGVAVLELATGRVTRLAESRNVDDQVEWLDDGHVVYGLPAEDAATDLWAVPADGSGAPRLLVRGAWSPAVVSSPS